jgi:hypothetical protein
VRARLLYCGSYCVFRESTFLEGSLTAGWQVILMYCYSCKVLSEILRTAWYIFSYCRYAGVGAFGDSADVERLARLLDLSVVQSTRVKYNSMWRRWELYCRAVNAVAQRRT